MNTASVTPELIKEAIAGLNERDELAKELGVVYGVIDLVHQGLVDSDDILHKVAEFLDDPESLLIFKKAAELTGTSSSLGTLVDSTELSKQAGYGESAETRLFSNIVNITNH